MRRSKAPTIPLGLSIKIIWFFSLLKSRDWVSILGWATTRRIFHIFKPSNILLYPGPTEGEGQGGLHHHHHPSASAEIPRTTSRHTSRSHMAARRSSTSNPASLDITLRKVNLLDLTGRWLGLHRRRRGTASPSARQQCPANSNLLLASLAEIGGSSL